MYVAVKLSVSSREYIYIKKIYTDIYMLKKNKNLPINLLLYINLPLINSLLFYGYSHWINLKHVKIFYFHGFKGYKLEIKCFVF